MTFWIWVLTVCGLSDEEGEDLSLASGEGSGHHATDVGVIRGRSAERLELDDQITVRDLHDRAPESTEGDVLADRSSESLPESGPDTSLVQRARHQHSLRVRHLP